MFMAKLLVRLAPAVDRARAHIEKVADDEWAARMPRKGSLVKLSDKCRCSKAALAGWAGPWEVRELHPFDREICVVHPHNHDVFEWVCEKGLAK